MENKLQSYEIQHPNQDLDDIIKKLQDLTNTNQLEITKDGLDQLNHIIIKELNACYFKGYKDGIFETTGEAI